MEGEETVMCMIAAVGKGIAVKLGEPYQLVAAVVALVPGGKGYSPWMSTPHVKSKGKNFVSDASELKFDATT